MNPSSVLPGLPIKARILVIRLRSIGDIVLLTPALRLLKSWRPDLRISVMIESRFRDLLDGNPSVDEVLSPGEERWPYRAIGSLFTAHELRRKKFSVCLNLHGGPRSAFLARHCGATWTAGFAHFRRSAIYNFAIPDARSILGQSRVHTAEHEAAAFFCLGLPRQPIPPSELFLSEAAKTESTDRMRALGIPPSLEYAIIQPTALYFTKEWPPGCFAQIGDYLEKSAGIIPIFSCGPGESVRLDEVEKALRRPIRRLEGLRLGAFMASLASARLFVGNDSGPAHLAAALRRPVVVVFGSSSSQIWGPWAGSNLAPAGSANADGRLFRIVQNFYDCNPCPGDRCYRFDRPQCILSVTFEQVKSAIDVVLKDCFR